ncbi:MAG: hypothetical protein ACRYFU_06135 [Janthinobacterium lividum]
MEKIMQPTAADLERFLTTFYSTTDCPFISSDDGNVTLACTREVLGLLVVPHPETAEEIANAMELPLSFVQAVVDGVEHRNLRDSASGVTLIAAAVGGDIVAVLNAADALVRGFWMLDLPDFETVANAWRQKQPATVPNSWWTHEETRPISEEGDWIY